ncbi:MAG TPA: hypothetical protein VFZ65_17855 [Planctomycetota bacterium]|nr:hypothetical protein [Planctomycetota bacterium]
MNTHALLVAVAVTLPLAAQGLSSPIQPVGALQAISHSSGLQADRDGNGLVGVGATYRVRFRDHCVLYEPALGTAAPLTQHVALSTPTVTRGSTALATCSSVAPVVRDRVASYARASGVEERFDVQPDGVELSWTFAERPFGEGDLVVHYAIETSLGEPSAIDGGLLFAGEYGGVRIGKVTGMDARGRGVDGRVGCDGRSVVFSLPAQFVDSAAYPITLDPLLGTSLIVGSIGGPSTPPDAAYDATTERWLVVWQRSFSASAQDPMAQLVSSTGTLIGPLLDLDPGASSSPPRVANLGTRDRFGIVYTKTVTVPSPLLSVEFRTVEAVTATTGSGATLATSALQQAFANADIGAECEAPIGAQRGFVVTYAEGAGNAIRARRLFFDAGDSLAIFGALSVWTGGAGVTFTEPAVSRAASADGKLLVVAKQLTGSPGSASIVAAVLDSGSNLVGAVTTVAASTANDLSLPDVDGFASKWVVAYQAPGGNLVSGPGVRVRPITLDSATNTLVVGSVGMSVGGFPTNQAFAPSVAYAAGRTWLGYESIGSLIGGGIQTSLRIAALNSGSCAFCNEQFVLATSGGWVAVSTMTSGGAPAGEDALSLTSVFPNISAQRLRNFGTVGTTASLGGGCGMTGTVAFNHAPGVGSSGFRCNMNSIPATALAAIFNFSAPVATLPCAACVWTPFAVTQSPPILGGTAFVEFPIPCLLTLLGQQFETQWTLLDFSQAPCPVFPGFALSDRTLLTIGN